MNVWCVFYAYSGCKYLKAIFHGLEPAMEFVEREYGDKYHNAYWLTEGETWIYELYEEPPLPYGPYGPYVAVEKWPIQEG